MVPAYEKDVFMVHMLRISILFFANFIGCFWKIARNAHKLILLKSTNAIKWLWLSTSSCILLDKPRSGVWFAWAGYVGGMERLGLTNHEARRSWRRISCCWMFCKVRRPSETGFPTRFTPPPFSIYSRTKFEKSYSTISQHFVWN